MDFISNDIKSTTNKKSIKVFFETKMFKSVIYKLRAKFTKVFDICEHKVATLSNGGCHANCVQFDGQSIPFDLQFLTEPVEVGVGGAHQWEFVFYGSGHDVLVIESS